MGKYTISRRRDVRLCDFKKDGRVNILLQEGQMYDYTISRRTDEQIHYFKKGGRTTTRFLEGRTTNTLFQEGQTYYYTISRKTDGQIHYFKKEGRTTMRFQERRTGKYTTSRRTDVRLHNFKKDGRANTLLQEGRTYNYTISRRTDGANILFQELSRRTDVRLRYFKKDRRTTTRFQERRTGKYTILRTFKKDGRYNSTVITKKRLTVRSVLPTCQSTTVHAHTLPMLMPVWAEYPAATCPTPSPELHNYMNIRVPAAIPISASSFVTVHADNQANSVSRHNSTITATAAAPAVHHLPLPPPLLHYSGFTGI
ncbi:hypothetical protein J6590_034267 [Homalodisca vitripennis]|nr:hypothetical protein J6590_034267 [Homalodisca vitripennis]